MNKLLALLFIFFSLHTSFLLAQESAEKIYLHGIKVLDAFTEEPLDRAHVSVLETDSSTVLVDSLQPRFIIMNNKVTGFLGFHGKIPLRKEIVLRIRCKGYPEEKRVWSLPVKMQDEHITTKKFEFKESIYLWSSPIELLPEVEVNASHIIMIMKGDTIEYNAAAFRMHEGSMLDNLIRILPGVKLDENGRITVNGEFVSSLFVNGRDFFNGDPKIALRNLPAYTVNKIKVYRHSEKKKYLKDNNIISEEVEKNSHLVMDVGLKREYAQGWISNYEVGGGSTLQSSFEEKWMGRLFALLYTNHSSLGIYAAANNINDEATPGNKGEWSKINAYDGEKKNYLGGIHFSLNPKDTKIRINSSLTVNHEKSLLQTNNYKEAFFTRVHTFDLSKSEKKRTATDIQWKGGFRNSCLKGLLLIESTAYYRRNKINEKSENENLQAEAGSELDAFYSRHFWNDEHETQWGTAINLNHWLYLPAGNFDFWSGVSYNNQERNQNESDRLLYAKQSERNSIEQRKYVLPLFNYNYYAQLSYSKEFQRNHIKVRPQSKIYYKQDFNSGHQDLHRNAEDWLAPSASVTSWTFDLLNTYHTTRLEQEVFWAPRLSFYYKNLKIDAGSELSLMHRRINDYRANNHQTKKTKNFLYNPELLFSWNKKSNYFYIIGSIKHQLPALSLLLDVTDNSKPLFRLEGNPHLKTTKEHYVSTTYKYQEKQNRMRFIEVKAGYMGWDNLISQALFYDAASGITTLRPMNIDGNWRAWAKASYRSMMGKGNNWTLSNDLEFNFHHSLDYISDQSAPTPSRSAVDNLIVDDKLRIDYRIREMHIGAKVEVNWKQQESLQHRFERQSFTHINYGITLSTPLFWGIHLGTDIMAYCRRGYSAPSLNTTDWVWNAELSRAVGRKKQWIIKAVGFDLLQEISSIRREVNAQGWTETRYNTKPSYAMLHVVYRLDVKPKKRLQKNFNNV